MYSNYKADTKLRDRRPQIRGQNNRFGVTPRGHASLGLADTSALHPILPSPSSLPLLFVPFSSTSTSIHSCHSPPLACALHHSGRSSALLPTPFPSTLGLRREYWGRRKEAFLRPFVFCLVRSDRHSPLGAQCLGSLVRLLSARLSLDLSVPCRQTIPLIAAGLGSITTS